MNDANMPLAERLKLAMKKSKISQVNLATACGVSPPSVNGWLSGKSKFLRGENLLSAAKALNVSPDWLATGEGRMDDIENILIPNPSVNKKDSYHVEKEIVLKQYDAGGGMGSGVELRDQPGLIHSWHVSPEWLQKNVPGFASKNGLCIVTGFGDSMQPMFNPGDPLIVDTSVNSVEFDAVYFFRVGNEGFIKRLQRIPGQGIAAISENKSYRDWIISDTMDFQVFGRVLKAWESKSF